MNAVDNELMAARKRLASVQIWQDILDGYVHCFLLASLGCIALIGGLPAAITTSVAIALINIFAGLYFYEKRISKEIRSLKKRKAA